MYFTHFALYIVDGLELLYLLIVSKQTTSRWFGYTNLAGDTACKDESEGPY